jgi:hypothetical protein
MERNTLDGLADLLRDAWTGLYNRDGFVTLGAKAMEEAARSGGTLVLVCARIENLAADFLAEAVAEGVTTSQSGVPSPVRIRRRRGATSLRKGAARAGNSGLGDARLGGRETVQALITNFEHLPLLFTSGYSPESRSLEDAFSSARYLQKPYSPSSLSRMGCARSLTMPRRAIQKCECSKQFFPWEHSSFSLTRARLGATRPGRQALRW